MDYWGITGYGINIDDIMDFVDKEKVKNIVCSLFKELSPEDDIFDDDTFSGNPYNGFAEFLCDIDDTNLIGCETDGQGTSYFLYIPPYPWLVRGVPQPKNSEEVAQIIIKTLSKVCNFDINNAKEYENIRKRIDYIDTYGYC